MISNNFLHSFFVLVCSAFIIPLTSFAQNVGIGTASPLFKLDVKNGSINTDSVYRISGSKILSANLQNTFVGFGAASSNTTGNFNTAMGNEALFANTTGGINTAVGYLALSNNTIGERNTAFGSNALYSNTIASYNTAVGALSLANNTASENTAVGYYALAFNTTGNENTAIGTTSLNTNTTGSYNTANGYRALYSNFTGFQNTAFGARALVNNTTGSNNVGIGHGANGGVTTGSGNIAIGVLAGITIGNLSNTINIGNLVQNDVSNAVRIGNSNITTISGQVSWTTYSDGRYKQNVQENVPGIAFINKLRPVTYTVDIKSLNENYYKLKPDIYSTANTSYRNTGFIAQEVERSATELGFSFSGVDRPQEPGKLYGLRYAEFVVPLVKAVQELSKQNDELIKRIEKLESLLISKK